MDVRKILLLVEALFGLRCCFIFNKTLSYRYYPLSIPILSFKNCDFSFNFNFQLRQKTEIHPKQATSDGKLMLGLVAVKEKKY